MSDEVVTRTAVPADLPAIRDLHARVLGPGRFARAAYRVREMAGQGPSPYCRVASLGERIIAAVCMTPVRTGATGGALLLGPLVVDTEFANRGYGRRIVQESLDLARGGGVRAVVLVGDEAYYSRLGFTPIPPGQIELPGPVDAARLLACELVSGALAGYRGLLVADGAVAAA